LSTAAKEVNEVDKVGSLTSLAAFGISKSFLPFWQDHYLWLQEQQQKGKRQ
jgi:hypothetical protein